MMPFNLPNYQFFEPGLYVGTFAAPMLCALLVAEHLWHWETLRRAKITILGIWSASGIMTLALTQSYNAITVAALCIVLSFISQRIFRDYYVTGQIMLAAIGPMAICGLGWSLSFIWAQPITLLSRMLLLLSLSTIILTSGFGLILILPAQAYLYRKNWHRPRFPLSADTLSHEPKVSFHLPCYAEPPAVVCATLQAIAEVNYSNYEVVVVDNNTEDPALWQPVQRYCEQLGYRFRFFHVDQLSGAKAGALNFALRHTSSDAELVAVIDADYQIQPDFLERLVGYFEDPNLGYVQTPHDYRSWQGNAYLEACYWEYMLYFQLYLSCLNEWTASHIIGTMCITRRQALEEAGGWAEWCLTEDSECAVRIHALGYSSLFINHTFGRGLIPENFRLYKKQRLRWTIGPIQQIQKHWPLYLPSGIGSPSLLTGWQKVIEIAHSIGGLRPAVALIGSPLLFLTLASITHNQEIILVPSFLWIMGIVAIPVGLAHVGLTFYLLGCRSLRAILGTCVVTTALAYVRLLGAFKGLSFQTSRTWTRTYKFKVLPNRLAALQTTWPEILLAILYLAIAGAIAPHASIYPPDLVLLACFGFFTQSLAFLMAPLMALLAENQLAKPDLNFIPPTSAEVQKELIS
ncbi:MAG: glycosyltransferase [Cyanobacteria bacterium P01_F01_bin.42]